MSLAYVCNTHWCLLPPCHVSLGKLLGISAYFHCVKRWYYLSYGLVSNQVEQKSILNTVCDMEWALKNVVISVVNNNLDDCFLDHLESFAYKEGRQNWISLSTGGIYLSKQNVEITGRGVALVNRHACAPNGAFSTWREREREKEILLTTLDKKIGEWILQFRCPSLCYFLDTLLWLLWVMWTSLYPELEELVWGKDPQQLLILFSSFRHSCNFAPVIRTHRY